MGAASGQVFPKPNDKGKEIMVTSIVTLKDLHGSERSPFSSPLIGKANHEDIPQCSVVR